MADGRVVRQGVTCFLKISSLRGSGRVGGSESDRCRMQPSTIGQRWQMGKWSVSELLIFYKSSLRGSGRVWGSESEYVAVFKPIVLHCDTKDCFVCF